ncbi:NAD-dependent succinate-semialdehyde dehydrogenase [Paraurantiacibacter namhicola]|uniref:Succinate-semialdehyde dehydrogenase [NADP(+)] GabD n=1 Tax=Paraurantiacibacter namhicola TaxID=645517 RepID=A0A1C7DB81_9SPHN|nr:NAD-dependent succinate-semialdehyde dehydrogenase [Paraurantiacibacter namhicola]ANU08760.1 Succinate-semialdehyde dehydrogenase [NADP(+)] GabD [Paraurantiacibacter namhicola]
MTTRGKLDNQDLWVTGNLIGGEWISASGDALEVDDPFTLEVIAEVPNCGAEETGRAIEAASDAFPGWADRTASERGEILHDWYRLIMENRDDLARIMVLENGKAWSDATSEVEYGAGFLKFFAQEATRMLGEIIPANTPGRRLLATREPVGVCAAITPWNFPLAMLTRKVGPALAAGCTMVAKPAAATPITALAFAKLGQKAGVPDGVFNIVTGDAKAIGGAMTEAFAVRKLSFTGSTGVGVKLYEQCAATMKKTSLELGGNAPFIVFDDADLETAVESAKTAKFRNSGQTCIAANRFLVQAGIHDEFVEAFGKVVGDMQAGDGFEDSSDIGPLIDKDGKDKVEEHRQNALDNGARVVAGGGSGDGRIVHPTLLADVSPDMQISCEETFGPVAAVMKFDTVDEGIRLANDTEFGLASYFCSRNPATIARVGRELEYGMVGVNTGLISTPHAPFGGVKMSGLGREGSHHGIEEYLHVKYLCEAGLDN